MNNNKTLVMDEPQYFNKAFKHSSQNNLGPLSSNKTIILSDDFVTPSHIPLKSNSNNRKATKFSQKNKFIIPFAEMTHSNALIGYASPIFSFINRIRTLKHYEDEIFQTAISLVNSYLDNLKNIRVKPEYVQSASYILCMSIDEVVLKCPWSVSTPWINKGILDTFFQHSQNEGYFLDLIEYYLSNQNTNRDILEVFVLCLSICSKGHNNSSQDSIQSENLRHKILNALKNHYAFDTSSFSPHGIPQDQVKEHRKKNLPIWVIASLCFAILFLTYLGFRIALSLTSEPIYNRIAQQYHFLNVNSTGDKK